MTPKTAPCFVHSGWYRDSTPMTNTAPAFILSTTQTPFIAGPLGLREVLSDWGFRRTSNSLADDKHMILLIWFTK
jgi:hypothetical protein